jgi:hypothetical protein
MAMKDELEAIWAAHETQVTTEEVERARAEVDPDQVVCHECARPFGQITEQHLQTHGMSLEEYEAAHPDARVYPDDDDRRPGRDPGFSHPEETKRKIAESTKQNHERGVYE